MNAEKIKAMLRVVVASILLGVVTPVYGAEYVWDANGSAPVEDGGGTWTAIGGNNWERSGSYGAWGNTTVDKAVIGVGNGAAGTLYQSGSIILNTLTFNAPGSGNYVLNQSGLAGTNVLSFAGTAPTIQVNHSATIDQNRWDGTDTIEFAGDTLTVNIASGQTLTTTRFKGANTSSTISVTGGGTLRLLADTECKYLNYSIASGSVVHLDGDREIAANAHTITGSGTLRLSNGMLASRWGGGDGCRLSLSSGGLIDIQSSGQIRNGGWTKFTWDANLADLNVDGTLDLWDGKTVYLDALTGSGTITKASEWSSVTMVVGVDNGSGTFSGTIITNEAGKSSVMNLVKTGSGTQTLAGMCEYAGSTTVSAGVLRLASGASLNPVTVVAVDAPGKLSLDVNQTVKQLLLDGVPKTPGTWGSTASAADNTSDMYFQGTGVLTVVAGPKAYTWDADGVAPLNDGAGSWVSSGGASWFDGSTYGSWGNTVTDVAVIGTGNGAAGAITQSGTITLNGLVFDAAGSGNYTLDQSAVSGANLLSFGGIGPSIIVNSSATIVQAQGGDDRIDLASGNLTINIASNQTLTMRKLWVANQNSSVIVTGGGTLDVLHEGYNWFMNNINGWQGSATLFIKGSSKIRLAEAFHCISDNVRVDVAAGSTFDQNGKSEGIGYISGAGSWINSGPSTDGLTLDTPSYFGIATFSGVLSGSGGLTLRGNSAANQQILSGTNSSYTGKTVIRKGTLQVVSIKNAGANSSLGAPTGGNATIELGNSSDVATLKYTGAGDSSDRVLDLAGTTGGAILDQSGAGLLKFTGAMTATGSGTKTLTLQGSGRGEFAGAIADSIGGVTHVSKAGSGIWVLSGANSFSGNVTLTPNGAYAGSAETLILSNATGVAVQGNVRVDGASGTEGVAVLKMGAPNQFGTGSVLTVVNASWPRQSVVKLMGCNQTVAGLEGGASGGQAIVQNTENESTAGTAVLLTINNAVDYTYAGTLRDTATGVGKVSITKSGPGTQTFSGTEINYTGDTAISNGVLSLVSGASLSTGSVVHVSAPGKLELATGNNQTVRELWLDGKKKWPGTWGAPGSGASDEDPHFQGGGILTVTTGIPKGLIILVR